MQQRLMGGAVSILHRGEWEQTGEVTVGRAVLPGSPEWLQDREGRVGSLDSACFLGNWSVPNPSLVRALWWEPADLQGSSGSLWVGREWEAGQHASGS